MPRLPDILGGIMLTAVVAGTGGALAVGFSPDFAALASSSPQTSESQSENPFNENSKKDTQSLISSSTDAPTPTKTGTPTPFPTKTPIPSATPIDWEQYYKDHPTATADPSPPPWPDYRVFNHASYGPKPAPTYQPIATLVVAIPDLPGHRYSQPSFSPEPTYPLPDPTPSFTPTLVVTPLYRSPTATSYPTTVFSPPPPAASQTEVSKSPTPIPDATASVTPTNTATPAPFPPIIGSLSTGVEIDNLGTKRGIMDNKGSGNTLQTLISEAKAIDPSSNFRIEIYDDLNKVPIAPANSFYPTVFTDSQGNIVAREFRSHSGNTWTVQRSLSTQDSSLLFTLEMVQFFQQKDDAKDNPINSVTSQALNTQQSAAPSLDVVLSG